MPAGVAQLPEAQTGHALGGGGRGDRPSGRKLARVGPVQTHFATFEREQFVASKLASCGICGCSWRVLHLLPLPSLFRTASDTSVRPDTATAAVTATMQQ